MVQSNSDHMATLERVEAAHMAYGQSTSEWGKNYWTVVIARLKNRL
jgi:hypothetical protein